MLIHVDNAFVLIYGNLMEKKKRSIIGNEICRINSHFVQFFLQFVDIVLSMKKN